MIVTARANYFSELAETWKDFQASVAKFPLVVALALQDILARYRGSVLGPWWITIATGALVLGIGVNYAALFKIEVREFLPYVALGLVIWGFISSCISESGESLVFAAFMLRQSSLPLPLFILRTLVRNLINLVHQLVIILAVLIYFRIFPGAGMLFSIVGFLIVLFNLAWVGLLLALISARFRDVPQIVSAVLQFVFFLSPIFWKPTAAMSHNPLVAYNPFYFAVQSVRDPLLTGKFPTQMVSVLVPLAILGWFFTILLYNQTRRRVVHYL